MERIEERIEALKSFVQYAEMKQLLDRLMMIQGDDKFASIAILSELGNEGKSFLTAALALAYTGRLKKRVLVIDTSTRKGEPVSASSSQLNELLDKVDSVDVISLRDWSGLKKGQEADEYQLKTLLSQSTSQYGMVLVDTCALARWNRGNLDPSLIGRQCDAALLVSSGNAVGDEISKENRKRLVNSGVNLVGVVHNQRGGAPEGSL